MSNDALQIVSAIPIFRHLTDAEKERVAAIVIERHYRKKSYVFSEGEEKEAVFFIVHGMVKTFKTNENGNEQIVSFLKTGDMFPHTGYFNHRPYPATAETLVDSNLIAIPIRAFEQLLLSLPTIAMKVIDVLGDKIVELQGKLQELTGSDVQDRILSFLVHLAEKHGTTRGGKITIDLPITHQEWASTVGTSRETVNRLLNQLRKDGLIDTNRNGVVIMDLPALKTWKP